MVLGITSSEQRGHFPSIPPRHVETNPGAASGFENLIAYPTEYIKTQQQLLKKGTDRRISPFKLFVETVRVKGLKQLYGGATVFCISNASKSAVRFFTFDFVKKHLSKSPAKKASPVENPFTGLIAGVAESLVVVTPGETLKTKLIEDRNRPGGPRYRRTLSAIRSIPATDGVGGLYRGALPVMIRQDSNAVVRFTTCNFLLDHARALSGDE
ncbi:uncharacterized protein PAC_01882 [Phialocephala subalpina]|uniref:Uncharacterized protein n=1 Tax=Phialocephala subalpina TaxID=576137 RepID=A0A1L7WGX0_9HELO|nr:uncharacterized protein PAC_01882 [Phialocephala subalpina]